MMSNTSHRVQRFHFSSFDASEPMLEAESQPAPIEEILETHQVDALLNPPSIVPIEQLITEQMLMEACEQARLQGYNEGIAVTEKKVTQEMRQREETIHHLLELISNRVTLAADAHSNYLKKTDNLLQKTALLIARKIAGDAIKRDPIAPIEALLKECSSIVYGEPRIYIMVSSNLVGSIKMHCETLRVLLAGFSGEILIEEDATLDDADCRVEWSTGRAERDTQLMWNEIETIVAQKIINS